MILFSVDLFNWIKMGVGFGILAGIPLFKAVAPMRVLAEGDAGWFGVRFKIGRYWGGGVGVTYISGTYHQEDTTTWVWNLGMDSPVLGRGSCEVSHRG